MSNMAMWVGPITQVFPTWSAASGETRKKTAAAFMSNHS